MKISSISLIESLKIKLLEFPLLVDSLQNKESDFLSILQTWMRETEIVLKNNNISQCSEIAGLRSKIIAPIFAEPQKRSNKKRQLQIAAEVLYDLQSTIFSVINPHQTKVNEARDLLLYLLSILQQSSTIKFNNGDDFQSFINQIWQLFSTHEQLKASTVKILSLVSKADALRIIAEEINLEDWH